MDEPFRGINHGTEKIDLTHLGRPVRELRPTEVHLKENGALGEKPSLCFVLDDGLIPVVGQISVSMLNKGLADIGYKLVKAEE